MILTSILEGKESIFLCLSQAHSTESISCYGGRFKDFKVTPHLDRIATDGIYFKNAFTSQSSTKVTLASILTGKTWTETKLRNGISKTQTIQHQFKKAGYQTAFFGAWPFEALPKDFDYWEILADSSQSYNPKIISSQNKLELEGHATDIITDRTLLWLDRRKGNLQPAFVILQFQGALKPWMPPIRFLELYNDKLLPEPETIKADYAFKAPASRYQQVEIRGNLTLASDLFVESDEKKQSDTNPLSKGLGTIYDQLNAEQFSAWQLGIRPQNEAFSRLSGDTSDALNLKYQRFVKNYLRCIRAIDENIGRLYDQINRELNSKEWTFIYSACKGNFVGENGWFGGNWMYEPSMRIPLIIKGDRYPKNKKTDAFISNLDIYPTLLQEKASHYRQEKDHELIFNTNSEKQTVYFEHSNFPDRFMVAKHYGIRTDRYKLIHYHQFNEWELFDLLEDPLEQTNIFHKTDQKPLIKELTKKLLSERLLRGLGIFPEPMPEEWRRIYRGPNARKKENSVIP